MTRLNFAAATVAALLATGALSLAGAKPATAHGWHPGVSVHFGHGAHGLYFTPGCRRFYRRYLRTGNVFWLDRYQACRYGY